MEGSQRPTSAKNWNKRKREIRASGAIPVCSIAAKIPKLDANCKSSASAKIHELTLAWPNRRGQFQKLSRLDEE
eukprot:1753716-Amphidinium_carterae.2